MKKFFNKIDFSILLIIIAIIIIFINRNFAPKLKIDLKELYQNNQFNQLNKNSFQVPLAIQLPSSSQNNSQTTSKQDSLLEIKPETTRTIVSNKEKEKIPINDSQVSSQSNVIALRCQDTKDKSLIFWLKENALYGEVFNRGIKIFVVIRDNCLWLWSLKNKNGLNVCSADINPNFLNTDLDKINDSVLKQLKTKMSNFNCSKEYVKENKFLPPNNIEFFLITDEDRNLF